MEGMLTVQLVREDGAGDAVSEGHGERGAVVDHVNGESVAAVKIDLGAGQVGGRNRRRSTIGVDAGGVSAFTVVVVEVELDRDALGDAASAGGSVRAVAEATAGGPSAVEAGVLNGESNAVRAWRC